ncbi:Ig-like domain-containing protein [bacterium]|nr:Ig-like domain-containing protein [bacterium]
MRASSSHYQSQAAFSSGAASDPTLSDHFRNQSGETVTVQNPPYATTVPSNIVASEGDIVELTFDDVLTLTSALDVDGDPITFILEAFSGELFQDGVSIKEAALSDGETLSWEIPLESEDPDPYLIITAIDPWLESASHVELDALTPLESSLVVTSTEGSVTETTDDDLGEAEVDQDTSEQTYTISNDVNNGVALMAGPGFGYGSQAMQIRTSSRPRQENVLVVSEILLDGLHPGDFSISGIDLPFALLSGESVSFVVTFSPSQAGDREAKLQIHSEGSRRPLFEFGVRGSGHHPPEARDDEVFRLSGLDPFRIPAHDLLLNDFDIDGDLIQFDGLITETSHHGRTLSLEKENGMDWIVYQPGVPDETPDDSFTYSITDGRGGEASAVVYIRDIHPGHDLQLLPIHDITLGEGHVVSFRVKAINGDLPTHELVYHLDPGAPSAAFVDADTGRFSWMTTESDGPGVFPVTIRVTDRLNPTRQAVESFTIVVTELNSIPDLPPFNKQTVNELETFFLPLRAEDDDLPHNQLIYSLDPGAPEGMLISNDALHLEWTPGEADGPGIYEVTLRVLDDGIPNLHSYETFHFSVPEVNSAPRLGDVPDQSVNEMETLSIQLIATDDDIPANGLMFHLEPGAPAGAVIDSNTGQFQWTPAEADGPGNYSVTVRLSDDGTPSLDALQTFNIAVQEANRAPLFADIANQSGRQTETISLQLSASDPDIPANDLTYELDLSAPGGATIDHVTGQFEWTLSQGLLSGIYPVKVWVHDNGNPNLTDEKTFKVFVGQDNTAPMLAAISNQTVIEGETISIQFIATDTDFPPDTLTFQLVNDVLPTATVDPQSGLFEWTPNEADGPGVFSVSIRVFDDGISTLEDVKTFEIQVLERNEAPKLSLIPNVSINELETLNLTFSATDTDLPSNDLTFELGEPAPEGLSLHPITGVLSWVPTEIEGPGQYTIKVLVSDDGDPILRDEQTFEIEVLEVNASPVWQIVGDLMLPEDEIFQLDLNVTDSDFPKNTIQYHLLDGPLNMNIEQDTGRVTWTPDPNVFGDRYDIKIEAVDNGVPSKRSELTFALEVTSVNDAPSLIVPEQVRFIEEKIGAIEGLKVSDVDAGDEAISVRLSVTQGSLSLDSLDGISVEGNTTSSLHLQGNLELVNEVLSSLKYEGRTDFYGQDTLTVQVDDLGHSGDGGALITTQTVSLEVTNVNDPPRVTPIRELVTNEDRSIENVLFSVIDTDSSVDSIVIKASARPESLFDPFTGTSVTLLSAPDLSYALNLEPLPDQFGNGVVELEVSDGLETTVVEIQVSIRSINDVPRIQTRPHLYLNGNEEEVTLPLTITDVDDPLQDLEVTAITDHPSFFEPNGMVTQWIDGTWQLMLTPNFPQEGKARIFLTASDRKSNDESFFDVFFDITDNPPVVEAPGNVRGNEDEPLSFLVNVTDDLLPIDQLQISVQSSIQILINDNDIDVVLNSEGFEVQLNPELNQSGMSALIIRVEDGTHVVQKAVAIEILPVLDAPRIMPVNDFQTDGNTPFEVEVELSDPDTPIANLTLTLESNYEGLLRSRDVVIISDGQKRRLQFSPTQNLFGIVEITLVVTDLDGLKYVEKFQIQIKDPTRQNTPPMSLRLDSPTEGGLQILFLSWLGGMDVFVSDQPVGPYSLLIDTKSPLRIQVKSEVKFYKLVPRPDQ